MKQFALPKRKESKGKVPAKKSQGNKTKTPPKKTSIDHILHLHQTIGNQAVQRMIKSGTLQLKDNRPQPGDIYAREMENLKQRVKESFSNPLAQQKALDIESQTGEKPTFNSSYQLTAVSYELPSMSNVAKRPQTQTLVVQKEEGSSKDAGPKLKEIIVILNKVVEEGDSEQYPKVVQELSGYIKELEKIAQSDDENLKVAALDSLEEESNKQLGTSPKEVLDKLSPEENRATQLKQVKMAHSTQTIKSKNIKFPDQYQELKGMNKSEPDVIQPMGGGAIAAVVVGGVLGVGLLAAGIYLAVRCLCGGGQSSNGPLEESDEETLEFIPQVRKPKTIGLMQGQTGIAHVGDTVINLGTTSCGLVLAFGSEAIGLYHWPFMSDDPKYHTKFDGVVKEVGPLSLIEIITNDFPPQTGSDYAQQYIDTAISIAKSHGVQTEYYVIDGQITGDPMGTLEDAHINISGLRRIDLGG